MPVKLLLIYLAPLLLSIFLLASLRRRRELRDIEFQQHSYASGLTEPASLHPVIDISRCIGCGSCADACPEHRVIGVVQGKAALVNPTYCIGHGACKDACPMKAITLVFGTEKRGVDIPHVKPDFETNVPGIYIAGELGGMGLIRNAIEQGKQAIGYIKKSGRTGKGDGLDLVIIGAGPAGIAASLAAKEANLDFVTLEQDSLGGTVAHFPRGKIVMTAPVKLPIIGKVKINETTKEALLELWESVVRQAKLDIHYNENVMDIVCEQNLFQVKTSSATHVAPVVLLAIGRRGTPRKLGVPGEESSKVVYRLIDPEQYRDKKVLVVGGGDSALEAAWSIAEMEGAKVTISYRSEAFGRAKEKNRQKITDAAQRGVIDVLFKSNVKEIRSSHVLLEQDGNEISIENDVVIVSAGGILPTPFLKKIGIEVETKHGTE